MGRVRLGWEGCEKGGKGGDEEALRGDGREAPIATDKTTATTATVSPQRQRRPKSRAIPTQTWNPTSPTSLAYSTPRKHCRGGYGGAPQTLDSTVEPSLSLASEGAGPHHGKIALNTPIPKQSSSNPLENC